MIIEATKYLFSSKKGLEQVPIEKTIDKFNFNIHVLENKIKKLQNISQQNVETLSKLSEVINTMSSFAVQYDYNQDVPFNGYRSLIKIWTEIIMKMNKIDDEDKIKEFLSAIRGMKYLFSFAIGYHENNHVNKYTDEDAKIIAEKFNSVFSDNQDIWEILNKTPINFVQLAPSMKLSADCMHRIICMDDENLNILQKIRSFYQQKYMVDKLNDHLNRVSTTELAEILRKLCARSHSGLSMMENVVSCFRKHSIVTTPIKMNLLSRYVIEISNIGHVDIVDNKTSNIRRPINFQITKNIGISRNDIEANTDTHRNKLMIFLHGGGFIAPKAKHVEHVYITPWAKAMPGLTIINFDYTLSPESRFSTQTQELVDFYLFLRGYQNIPPSDIKVIDLLGFIPNDIIFVGDSAGAHIALSATIALNDIKNMFDKNIKMPKSLVLLYPKVCMSYQLLPSAVNAIWDPLLFPQICPLLAQSYVPLIQTTKDADDNSNISKTRILPIEEQISLNGDCIFDSDKTFLSSVYLNPFTYANYEQLANINLKLLSFEFDPLLDESILLAKKWKGNVDIKILPNLCHAAIIFRHFSKEAREAFNEGTRMIIDALNK